jgi:hypothetical protein
MYPLTRVSKPATFEKAAGHKAWGFALRASTPQARRTAQGPGLKVKDVGLLLLSALSIIFSFNP